jgi:hypothetical protein
MAEITLEQIEEVAREMESQEISAIADGRELHAEDLLDVDKEARAWNINVGC